MEAKHGLSQNCVNIIVEEIIVEELGAVFTDIKEKISDKFHKILKEKKDEEIVDAAELLDQFNFDNIPNKFGSACNRKKFYEENFKMAIPQSVFINTEMKHVNSRMTLMNNYGYYIPFLSSLQGLLEMPEVSYWVMHDHKSSDDTFRDWCDGEFLRSKNLTNTLLIILNLDDIETVNPIGMSKKNS